MDSIKSFLEVAKLTRKQVYRNLTVFPLLAPDGVEPDYLTLEQNLIRILSDISQVLEVGDIFIFWMDITGLKSDPWMDLWLIKVNVQPSPYIATRIQF